MDLFNLLDDSVEAHHLAERGAVGWADLNADVAIGADIIVHRDLLAPVIEQGGFWAGFDTDAAAVTFIDRVRVVARDAVEVAALEEDDKAVARSVDRAKPDYIIEVPLGCFHG